MAVNNSPARQLLECERGDLLVQAIISLVLVALVTAFAVAGIQNSDNSSVRDRSAVTDLLITSASKAKTTTNGLTLVAEQGSEGTTFTVYEGRTANGGSVGGTIRQLMTKSKFSMHGVGNQLFNSFSYSWDTSGLYAYTYGDARAAGAVTMNCSGDTGLRQQPPRGTTQEMLISCGT